MIDFNKLDINQFYVDFNHKRWFLISAALFIFGVTLAFTFPNILPLIVKKVNISFRPIFGFLKNKCK